MKKLLALLLALVMIFALAACGSNDKDDKNDEGKQTTTLPAATTIVGNWKYSISLSGESMGYEGISASINVEFFENFKEDGSIELSINEESLRTSMTGFEAALVDWMVENYYGGDESLRDAIAQNVKDMDMAQMMIDSYAGMRGTYTVDGDKLTVVTVMDADVDIPEEVYTFKFVGSTVELYAANDATEEAFEGYGIDKLVLNPA